MDLVKLSNSEFKNIYEQFGRLDVHKESRPTRFLKAILDRFEHSLSEEEANKFLFASIPSFKKDSNQLTEYMQEEEKYLNFFEFAFKYNNQQPIFIYICDVSLSDLMRNKYKWIWDYLNKEDRELLRKLIKDLIKNNNRKDMHIFKSDNIKVIKLFAKLSMREICFSNFFFLETKSLIIGNYDMSLPVYTLSKDVYDKYRKKANEFDLYLRTE